MALQRSYSTLWPEGTETAPDALRSYPVCGANHGFKAWVTCEGSIPTSRGYSCGLWELFHTVAFRLPDATAAQSMMTALLSFNKHFFLCEPCQKHFGKMLTAPESKAVTSKEALVTWLWRAHNEVNGRLKVIESKYGHSTTGDPAYPKQQWPTREMCPACHLPASTDDEPQWDMEQVVDFLRRAYGLRKDEK